LVDESFENVATFLLLEIERLKEKGSEEHQLQLLYPPTIVAPCGWCVSPACMNQN